MSNISKIPDMLVEPIAAQIYELIPGPDNGQPKPEWVPHGNSHKQVECRHHAREILDTVFYHEDVQELEKRVLENAVDRMTWEEINAYHAELRKGQDYREDAGGFFLRAIRRLFGLGSSRESVETYTSAARRMMERLYE